jgi:hypothetical protein
MDTDLKGFGIRATKEVLTFFVRSTIRGTVKREFVPIGVYGTFTTAQARNVAKDYLRCMDMGENPHSKAQPKREIITIQHLYSQYISSKKTPLDDSTLYQYKSWMSICMSTERLRDPRQRIADKITELATVKLVA